MAISASFLGIAQESFNPYALPSGTEHVAFLLYSLVRMTRPRTVVEYGSGYTTLFLLAALAENATDFEEERAGLQAKTEVLGDDPLAQLKRKNPAGQAWLAGGGKACAVDPGFYLEPHRPRLYAFEEHAQGGEYAQRLTSAVRRLELSDYLTYVTGAGFSAEALPAEALPIDLAWNDDKDYQQFFESVWPRLNPDGGLMAFHNTVSVAQSWNAIQWMKARQAEAGDLETLTLCEPHKLSQNSCTILRRTSACRPRLHTAELVTGVGANLLRFMRSFTS